MIRESRRTPASLPAIHSELLRLTLRWSLEDCFDVDEVRQLRRDAFSLLHRQYFDRIGVYRAVAERQGVGPEASFDTLRRHMLLPDGIFKSYPQAHLDARDFSRMNEWLGGLFNRPIDVDVRGVASIDQWLARLGDHGVHTVFSSGTSGNLSFVPRDEATWHAFRKVPLLYTPGFLARRGLGPAWKNALVSVAARTLGPSTFQSVFERLGLREFDGIFLNFTGGNQGIQLVGAELAQKVRKATFLYPIAISATALRTLVRGSSEPADQQLADTFIRETVRDKDRHFRRVIEALETARKAGQKVLLFGAPFLVKELCDRIIASNKHIDLHPGSVLFHGGGWKSFEGRRLDENELLGLVERATSIAPERAVEAYSMTEICALMPKCERGRFHVPPYLETVLLDESLEPAGPEHTAGILGVMDPFAQSYPGFLITGDSVRRSSTPCPCGVAGESLIEVGRAPGAEVKGCGGIMAAVSA